MKNSLLLLLALISLTFTSCSLIRGVETEDIKTPTVTPEIVVPQEEVPVIAPQEGKETTIKPNVDKIPDNDTTSCSENTDCQKSEMCYFKPGGEKGSCIKRWNKEGKPNEEISTEDLTKELDAFVDDITKGL